MRVRRQTAAAAVTGIIAALTVWPAAPASAHGAPSSPASRAFACRPEAPTATSAACVAAVAETGRALGSWDNLRVPGINGRNRQFIPDGQLCSASLPEFRGLDLARPDWPATAVTAGTPLKMQYMATIPHAGRFQVFLTKATYTGADPLRWADLEDIPLVDVTDPPLAGDVYTLTGTLPPNRSGRHVLYTVWQNSSTPDTYYSCSDLDVRAAGGRAAAPPPPVPPQTRPERSPGPAPTRSPAPPSGSAGAAAPAPSGSAAGLAPVPPPPPTGAAPDEPVGRQSWLGRAEPVIGDRVALGQQIMSAALIVLFGVTGGAAFLRIRAARNAEGLHRRPGNR
jgi:chitin-binding protein